MATTTAFDLSDIEEWVSNLVAMYNGKVAGVEPSCVWSRVAVHGSAVGEAFRENRFGDLVKHLGQSLGWELVFFGLARSGTWGNLASPFAEDGWDGIQYPSKKKYDHITQFGEVVHYHYPEVCPHCLGKRCSCAPSLRLEDEYRRERIKTLRWETKGRIDTIWDELEKRLLDLYSHDDIRKSYAEIGFHFLEEIGEVTNAIEILGRAKERIPSIPDSPTTGTWAGQFIEELADVVSWATSLVRRIKLDLQNYCALCDTEPPETHLVEHLSLQWVLVSTYIRDGQMQCPTCGESICKSDCVEC